MEFHGSLCVCGFRGLRQQITANLCWGFDAISKPRNRIEYEEQKLQYCIKISRIKSMLLLLELMPGSQAVGCGCDESRSLSLS